MEVIYDTSESDYSDMDFVMFDSDTDSLEYDSGESGYDTEDVDVEFCDEDDLPDIRILSLRAARLTELQTMSDTAAHVPVLLPRDANLPAMEFLHYDEVGNLLPSSSARTSPAYWKGTKTHSCKCKRHCYRRFNPEWLFHLQHELDCKHDIGSKALKVRDWVKACDGSQHKFFLPARTNGTPCMVRVCRLFWQKSLHVGTQLTTKLISLLGLDEAQHFPVPTENRGKWDRSRNFKGKVDQNLFHNFVHQLPRQFSHFCRAQQNVQIEYLKDIRKKKELHIKYMAYCRGQGKEPMSETHFRRLWKKYYKKKLKVHPLQLDCCNTCLMLASAIRNTKNEQEKMLLQCKFTNHLH
jgi:hypothetical protein